MMDVVLMSFVLFHGHQQNVKQQILIQFTEAEYNVKNCSSALHPI